MNHFHQFKEELFIAYESITAFKATRKRLPLPIGWFDCHDAPPSKLLARNYDKIIHVSRDLIELSKALAYYHRGAKTKEDYINLILKEPDFFSNIQKRWKLLHEDIEDPRFLRITLRDWRNHTLQIFNKILDFLEYPKENRLALAPVPFIKEERDFEGYSCSHLPIEYQVCKRLEEIRQDG